MDKENVIHMHYGILFSCKEKWNQELSRKMDRTRKDYIKLDNPSTERQMLHVIFSSEAPRPKY